MSPAVPMLEHLGTYRILRRLGAGGFAEVFLAEDTSPSYRGDRVAVKRIRPELLEQDPLYRNGLKTEGELGRYIRHPNVVQTYDLIEEKGQPYLVTEYVDGILLSELLKASQGPLEPSVAAEVARQLCEGLSAIHQAVDGQGAPLNVVHQDVKPANVCINRRGDVKLLDLGIARSRIRGHGGLNSSSGPSPYQSPEQTRGEVVLSQASDQYAVGVLVFEMLSGIPFLAGLEALAVQADHAARREALAALPPTEDSIMIKLEDIMLDETPEDAAPFASPPPDAGDISARQDWARRELPNHLHDLDRLPGAGLDEILGRMLAYDPAERYPTAQQAGAELLRWAWGTGNGVDFREYVREVIARVRGDAEEPAPEPAPPLDEAAIQVAADSSFLPKAYVLGIDEPISAFLPPVDKEPAAAPVRSTNNLARPQASSIRTDPGLFVPGAILDQSGSYPGSESMPGPTGGAMSSPYPAAHPSAPPSAHPSAHSGAYPPAHSGAYPPAFAGGPPGMPGGMGGMPGVPTEMGALPAAPRPTLADRLHLRQMRVAYMALGAAAMLGGVGLWALHEKSVGQRVEPPGQVAGAEKKGPTVPGVATDPQLNRRLEEPLPGDRGASAGSGGMRGLRGEGGAAEPEPARTANGMRGLRGDDGRPAGEEPVKPAGGAVAGGTGDAGEEPGELKPEKLTPYRGKRRSGSARLTVSTSPPGGQVILDGVTIEQAPITWESVPAGQHQLILRNEELGKRDVNILDLRTGQNWHGTWSFHEHRWIDLE